MAEKAMTPANKSKRSFFFIGKHFPDRIRKLVARICQSCGRNEVSSPGKNRMNTDIYYKYTIFQK